MKIARCIRLPWLFQRNGRHAGRAADAHVRPFIHSSATCHGRNFKGEFRGTTFMCINKQCTNAQGLWTDIHQLLELMNIQLHTNDSLYHTVEKTHEMLSKWKTNFRVKWRKKKYFSILLLYVSGRNKIIIFSSPGPKFAKLHLNKPQDFLAENQITTNTSNTLRHSSGGVMICFAAIGLGQLAEIELTMNQSIVDSNVSPSVFELKHSSKLKAESSSTVT